MTTSISCFCVYGKQSDVSFMAKERTLAQRAFCWPKKLVCIIYSYTVLTAASASFHCSQCVFICFLFHMTWTKAAPRYFLSWSFFSDALLESWCCPPAWPVLVSEIIFFFKMLSQMFFSHSQILNWRRWHEVKSLINTCFFQTSGKTCGQ